MEYEECTEDKCIMMIQEMLQVENLFVLQVIGEGENTQMSLKWVGLDDKRVKTDICKGCDTFELNERVEGLVRKLESVIPRGVVLVKSDDEELRKKKEEEPRRQRGEELRRQREIKLKKQEEGLRQNIPDFENNDGFDLGFINSVENADGVQIALISNYTKNYFSGYQFSLLGNINQGYSDAAHFGFFFNVNKGESKKSHQYSALVNYADTIKIQCCYLLNYSRDVDSFQFGLFNIATDYGYTQIGVFFNYAELSTFQFGAINYAEDLDGFQIGLINIAENSRGYQIGLINIHLNAQIFKVFPIINIAF